MKCISYSARDIKGKKKELKVIIRISEILSRDTIESIEWKWILEVREMHTKQLNESQSYSARSKNRMER